MKSLWTIVITIAVIVSVLWTNQSAAPQTLSHPLELIFAQYQTTNRFEIPENFGPTAEEKAKWSLLRDIITCESASRWVIVEVPGIGWDVGPCQLQTKYHILPAARKGLDLFSPNANMLYCIDLFERYYPVMLTGKFTPWDATRSCWKHKQNIRRQMIAQYE